MHLLLSGEGKSDIGYCTNSSDQCDADDFLPRAMAIIIDQIINQWGQEHLKYEPNCLQNQQVSFASESYLAKAKVNNKKKSMRLPGKRKTKETAYFYYNARCLACLAKLKQRQLNTNNVIAVLFRDADGTASSGRGEYENKISSMQNGFTAEEFQYGVAMIPKPKSEAWLLCALKNNPYQHCHKLENESGNDKSPNSLKKQLEKALSSHTNSKTVEDMLNNGSIDISRIVMPSFNRFRADLETILEKVHYKT